MFEPLSMFQRLAGTVLAAFDAGHGESCDGSATRGVLHFHVFAESTAAWNEPSSTAHESNLSNQDPNTGQSTNAVCDGG